MARDLRALSPPALGIDQPIKVLTLAPPHDSVSSAVACQLYPYPPLSPLLLAQYW